MELLGMWDLGYLAWTKATDLTKHGEFFSIYLGRIISLLFGHIHVWVDFDRVLEVLDLFCFVSPLGRQTFVDLG